MVTITLYARQQKRHRCIEQSFGLCGRGRGWADLGEWHWNMYNIIYEMNHQSKFDAWGWWTGKTQGREKGVGFRMGNTCIPVADSYWCMAKSIQYLKNKKRKERKWSQSALFVFGLCQSLELFLNVKKKVHNCLNIKVKLHIFAFLEGWWKERKKIKLYNIYIILKILENVTNEFGL